MDPVRVIVVDDAADARFLIGLVLRDADGVEVAAEAADAAGALAAFGDGSGFDAALVDARMPAVDGFELASRMRERAPGFPIAVLTSVVDEAVEARALEAGAQACWSKADLEELPARLRRLVAER